MTARSDLGPVHLPRPAIPAPRPRIQYLDFTKGILIFLVVWGHLIQQMGYADFGFYEDPAFKAIYIFHMPLFMAISGYLSFASIQRTSFWNIVTRRFVQLLVPAFIWAAVFQICLSLEFLYWDNVSIRTVLTHFPGDVFKTVHTYWFLWALFLFTVVVGTLKRMGKDTIVPMAVVCIAYTLIPGLGKDYLFKFTLPFFCLGYQVARSGIPSFWSRWPAALVTGAASILIYLLWRREDYVYVSQMVVSADGIRIILVRLFSSTVVSIFALMVFLPASRVQFLSIFLWFGRRSLEIYILHLLVLRLMEGWAGRIQRPVNFSVFQAPPLALGVCFLCATAALFSHRFWQRTPAGVPAERHSVSSGA